VNCSLVRSLCTRGPPPPTLRSPQLRKQSRFVPLPSVALELGGRALVGLGRCRTEGSRRLAPSTAPPPPGRGIGTEGPWRCLFATPGREHAALTDEVLEAFERVVRRRRGRRPARRPSAASATAVAPAECSAPRTRRPRHLGRRRPRCATPRPERRRR
jgi:hypothetical protein